MATRTDFNSQDNNVGHAGVDLGCLENDSGPTRIDFGSQGNGVGHTGVDLGCLENDLPPLGSILAPKTMTLATLGLIWAV